MLRILPIFCCLASFTMAAPLMSECFKCEEIKEKNKNLPPLKHEYYDDYLEELRAEGKSQPGEIDFANDEEAENRPSLDE